MSLFDLLFIFLFLTAAFTLFAALVAAVTGRRGLALRRLRALAIGAAAYMLIVTLVSLASPRRVLAPGADQCSDDWCIAVMSVTRTAADPRSTYHVIFRVSSRAKRVSQRERFVVAYMRDSAGHRYDAGPGEGQAPFDVRLAPGESVLTARTFDVPGASAGLGVVVAREGDFGFPRCCVIGLGPFFKPPIVYAE